MYIFKFSNFPRNFKNFEITVISKKVFVCVTIVRDVFRIKSNILDGVFY